MRRTVTVLVPIAIVAAVLIAWRAGYFDATRLATIRAAIRAAREVPLAPLLFGVSWVLAVILLLPTTALSIIGGAVFGMVALPIGWGGALAGSACAYALGRYTGRRATKRFLGNHPMLERLRDDVSFWDLVRVRVIPAAPFGVLDYLSGMSGVPLRALLVATAVGIVPTMIAYVFAGSQLARVLENGGSASRPLLVAGVITGVLVLAAAAPSLVKLIARRGAKSH